MRQEAARYLSDAPSDPAQMTPEQAQAEIARQLPALARGGAEGAQAGSRIVAVVAAQRKITRPEAQAQVTRAKADQNAKTDAIQTAKSAADAAAGAAAGTSSVIVLALLVGAGAAGFGATAATRRRMR